MKDISIIVPVYNAEKDIGKCVDSIISQTYENWELWLIDDGSSDNSPLLCDEFASCDERIKVVHKKNGGVSSARNIGIKEAEGDYILFADSDDYLEPDALEKLIKEAKREKADVVICGFCYRIIDNGGCIRNVPCRYFAGNNRELLNQCFTEMFWKDLFNPPWNKLIKRKVIEQSRVRFNEEISILEDLSFSLQILGACEKIVVLQDTLYNYVFKSQDNLVNKFHPNFLDALKYLDGCLAEYILKNSADALITVRQDFFAKKIFAYLRKVYTDSGYDNKRKYQEICEICNDETVVCYISRYRAKELKKKTVQYCIKHKKYMLLHLLYLLT